MKPKDTALTTRFLFPTLAFLLSLLSFQSYAQEIRYVSDTQYVPLRSGQGNQYRIVHRGIPSGTRVTVGESNEESGYSFITTDGGTEGWIRTQYLMSQVPAAVRLRELQAQNAALMGDENSLRSQLVELRENSAQLSADLADSQASLQQLSSELTQVRRVSSNALELDASNQRLTEEAQVMRTRMEVLQANNLRLKEKADSDAFLNGALAVLLGVIITLLVPRLRPKPRSSSSWT